MSLLPIGVPLRSSCASQVGVVAVDGFGERFDVYFVQNDFYPSA
jgi:hypothetical protein